MSFWTMDALRTASGGSWAQRPAARLGADSQVGGVSIDTRTLRPGQAFIAVQGDTFDGHDFVAEAAARGASLAVVHRQDAPGHDPGWPGQLPVIRVPDTRRALLRLASAYRQSLEGRVRVIGITGSNGKSTSTRFVQAVLSAAMPGTASEKSFNNSVGVPLTILGTKPGDRFLVCEIGTNHPGEVAELARVVNPHIGVVTSIGREHLQDLGDLERVAREELSLLEFLRPGGFAIVNSDAPHVEEMAPAMAASSQASLYRFGRNERADLRVSGERQQLSPTPGLWFQVHPPKAGALHFVPVLGAHNALNAAAAIAVGRRLGVSDDLIAQALSTASIAPMRCEYRAYGAGESAIGIVNDAYNANPDSMLAALKMLAALPPLSARGARVAILGDMLELGDMAPALHAEVLAHAASEPNIHRVVTVGEMMAQASCAVASDKVLSLGAANQASMERAASAVFRGDLVLVKASRGIRLERIIEMLVAGITPKPVASSPPSPPAMQLAITPSASTAPLAPALWHAPAP